MRAVALAALLALPPALFPALTGAQEATDGVFVQETGDGTRLEQRPNTRATTSINAPPVAAAEGAVLRALDKTLGQPTDIEMSDGQTVVFGRIAIRMFECRYPIDNPSSDAFAHIQILDLEGTELFNGWMVASSPALVALEHPRYDVWVLRCRTS
ncbi:DUF2155 domain-containing protein [Rhodophyticola sp. CCM32]|uniref:DUF2155 domain-containing protein n=1 Tax=Rhodophyticola sp. CCM32 TaxID=2916397 RepID=UPI00107F185C|nr:DUF2155 domain-containing protein [Rhodophyticola sp. CCM32]QBY00916.1 DUF2155 domain-containing protein [Rhodophyticola sp. CCM32]